MKTLDKRLRSVRKNIIAAMDAIVLEEKPKVPSTPEEISVVHDLRQDLKSLKDKVDKHIGE